MSEEQQGFIEFEPADNKGYKCYIHAAAVVAVIPGNQAYGSHICLVGGAGYVRVVETVDQVMAKLKGEQ